MAILSFMPAKEIAETGMRNTYNTSGTPYRQAKCLSAGRQLIAGARDREMGLSGLTTSRSSHAVHETWNIDFKTSTIAWRVTICLGKYRLMQTFIIGYTPISTLLHHLNLKH